MDPLVWKEVNNNRKHIQLKTVESDDFKFVGLLGKEFVSRNCFNPAGMIRKHTSMQSLIPE